MKVAEDLCNVLEAVLERYLRALIRAEFIERDVEQHDIGERMGICLAFRRREARS